MKDTLVAGLEATFRYRITRDRTVPRIYPDAPDFQLMPEVLATGYFVALCEWACIELIKPHLDWPREMTLGTRIEVSHTAATPPGLTVAVSVRLESIEGRKLAFAVSAHDGIDAIGAGRHERHVIDTARFESKVAAKAARVEAVS